MLTIILPEGNMVTLGLSFTTNSTLALVTSNPWARRFLAAAEMPMLIRFSSWTSVPEERLQGWTAETFTMGSPPPVLH